MPRVGWWPSTTQPQLSSAAQAVERVVAASRAARRRRPGSRRRAVTAIAGLARAERGEQLAERPRPSGPATSAHGLGARARRRSSRCRNSAYSSGAIGGVLVVGQPLPLAEVVLAQPGVVRRLEAGRRRRRTPRSRAPGPGRRTTAAPAAQRGDAGATARRLRVAGVVELDVELALGPAARRSRRSGRAGAGPAQPTRQRSRR